MRETIIKETKIYNESKKELAWLNDQYYCNLIKNERHI